MDSIGLVSENGVDQIGLLPLDSVSGTGGEMYFRLRLGGAIDKAPKDVNS